MPAHEPADSRLVLADPGVEHTAPGAYKGLHALVPILIGLSAPIVLFMLFDPRALGNVRLIAHILMLAVVLIAATMFFLSAMNPGHIVEVAFDPARRTVDLVQSGAFANKVTTIRFDQVQTARIETAYDDDGYQQRIAVIVLKNRETYQLPAGTTDGDIAAVRATLGLR